MHRLCPIFGLRPFQNLERIGFDLSHLQLRIKLYTLIDEFREELKKWTDAMRAQVASHNAFQGEEP